MRTERTYYDTLGLPKDATLAQIKRRYRQLVQKYHPDVAADKDNAHKIFIQITEAYEALSDPARRKAYDANLESQPARAAARVTQTRERSSDSLENVGKLISDAQFAYIHRRFSEAMNLCKRAVTIEPRNARAYAIMGDACKAQGKRGDAIKYYTLAVQFDGRDEESHRKLMTLLSKQFSKPQVQPAADKQIHARLIPVNIVLFALAGFMLYLIKLNPGQHIYWLEAFPQADQWSYNLAGFIAAASIIVGFTLSINGILAHPDEELIFEGGDNWIVVPSGLILLLGSGLFFLGAAAIYFVAGLAQGSLSRSVMTVFACVMAIILLAGLMYTESYAIKQVLLLGGNVSFIPMLAGWYIGAATRPVGSE